ncbi:MAG: protein kinase [Gemmataceae bacterium]|nr:protein kinase [Gemmataceae bacterium]
MSKLNAASVAQHALRLGLVTDEQLQDGWDELGKQPADPKPLLRVLERKGHLTPWQSQKLLKGELDGFFLGGYRILYRIASGSFGRVYRADDPQTGNVVAIKVLRRKWAEDRHNVELFEREGKVGMALHHPNVVEILAVNRDPTSRQYYLVMEFIEGGNLRDFLAIRKKLEPAEALRIIDEATAGLAYAHSRGVTHRDIKPTNILISSQGTAKLVDFGLAGVGTSLAGQSEEIQVDRTVDYAGLEKATLVPHGDVRSDIYFLGCVLYELVTGRPPLEMTRDPKARMRPDRFNDARPIEPDEVGGQLAVIRLVSTMMSLNPHERFQTPAQLLDAIRDVRREVEGSRTGGRASLGGLSVFVVEKDARLQDALREKLKELGFRPFIAGNPLRALDRFRQHPFDALVVDAGTTGEEGRLMFDRVLNEAERLHAPCAGVLILSEDQLEWKERVEPRDRMIVLVRPVTMKQLHRALRRLLQPE